MRKKKLLFITDYPVFEPCSEKRMPRTHLFGSEALWNEYNVTYHVYRPCRTKSIAAINLIINLFAFIKIYIKSWRYTVIYDAMGCYERAFGLAKKYHILHPKLVTIMHHPPFDKRLTRCKYDAVIILAELLYNDLVLHYPHLKDVIHFCEWGPDHSFYESVDNCPNYKKERSEIVFISNGRTQRDHELLVKVASTLPSKTIIVTTHKDVPHSFNSEMKNVELFFQDSLNDKNMVELLSKCSVLVIPTFKSDHILGPIGNTGFMDALALGMPVIVSNVSMHHELVKKNKIGQVYEAGDFNSLKKAMAFFLDKNNVRSYGEKAYYYGKDHSFEVFSSKIRKIINEVVVER